MNGWIEQWYVYVPGWSRVTVKEPPVGISPESQAPVVLVAVCVIESVLVKVTAWPALTVMLVGEKANLSMVTPAPAATATPGMGWITIFRGALPTGTVALTV